ncbi:SLC17A9 [Bugula neritina]|uniref:SLC17A9 n=1 Tax=Bugula neritina TaxID=10212 RepID=A0A7J7K4U3_BUGNE|nr:SLC17A9 [Bugula neritina]
MSMPSNGLDQQKSMTSKECSSKDIKIASSQIWSPERQAFMMWMYFAGSIIVYASRTAMALCMPEMYDEFGWDKRQQGLVMACFLWGYPITQILGGYMADRFGAERVILCAGVCWTTITLFTPVFPYLSDGSQKSSLSLVIFSRMSQGVLQGMHYPSVMSATGTHVVETERTQVYSLISAGTHGGTLFTGLFGSIILHHFGWGSVFNFLGVLGYIWIALLYAHGDTKNHKPISVKENISSENPSKKASKPLPWRKVLTASPFWAMILAHFANGYSYFVFLFWLPSYFHENHPHSQPWVYNVLPWLISMVSAGLFGKLATYFLKLGYSKTFIRKSFNVFAMLVFGMALLSISYSHSYQTTLFIFCVAAASNGAYQSTVIMNPSDIAPDHTGFMFGVMNTFGAIPGFIGTYVSGAILEMTSNWNLMYSVTGWVSIAGWAVFAYWGSGEPIF